MGSGSSIKYAMCNDDNIVATFIVSEGRIKEFSTVIDELLPYQLHNADASIFNNWLSQRAVDLSVGRTRVLANMVFRTTDKVMLSIQSGMVSISDKFTCYQIDNPTSRAKMLVIPGQDIQSFVLLSSDTSLGKLASINRNQLSVLMSTNGSFPKIWKYVNGDWWLYKRQSVDAVKSEYNIQRILRACSFDACDVEVVEDTLIRARNFVYDGEFFEPYESFRFAFNNITDDWSIIENNFKSLDKCLAKQYRRILLADCLFMNPDRHLQNFGVIRSTTTGAVLRLAPNFDNNIAYQAAGGSEYSLAMLEYFKKELGLMEDDKKDLSILLKACALNPYFKPVIEEFKACFSNTIMWTDEF